MGKMCMQLRRLKQIVQQVSLQSIVGQAIAEAITVKRNPYYFYLPGTGLTTDLCIIFWVD